MVSFDVELVEVLLIENERGGGTLRRRGQVEVSS